MKYEKLQKEGSMELCKYDRNHVVRKSIYN